MRCLLWRPVWCLAPYMGPSLWMAAARRQIILSVWSRSLSCRLPEGMLPEASC